MGIFCSCWGSRNRDDLAEANEAYDRYLKTKNTDELTKALGSFQKALEKCRESPDTDNGRLSVILVNYAQALYTRYTNHGHSADDLAKVIELDEEAYDIFEKRPDAEAIAPEHERLLLNLGDAYFLQYNRTSDQEYFDKAIDKHNKLQLSFTASLTLRRKGAISMADALIKWAEEQNKTRANDAREKVDQAIGLLNSAKDRLGHDETTSEDPAEIKAFQEKCFFNLAMAYNARYTIEKDSGEMENGIPDLDQAINYNRQARDMLLISQHPELVYCLFDLAQQLAFKYECYSNQPEGLPADDALKILQEVKEFADEVISVTDGQQADFEKIRNDALVLKNTAEEHISDLLPPSSPSQ